MYKWKYHGCMQVLLPLWIYKISFMLWLGLPQNFFHLSRPRPPTTPLSIPHFLASASKFGGPASLSNYLYGIHNLCWWSFAQVAPSRSLRRRPRDLRELCEQVFMELNYFPFSLFGLRRGFPLVLFLINQVRRQTLCAIFFGAYRWLCGGSRSLCDLKWLQ